MTDEQIIKALECCYDLDSSAICHQCPLYQTEECRDGYIGLQAYHLINRLQAEIERLQKVNDSFTDIGKLYSEIKSEAIKEFAERLKNIYIKDKRYDRPNAHTLIDWLFANIDNLVKEMVGEAE